MGRLHAEWHLTPAKVAQCSSLLCSEQPAQPWLLGATCHVPWSAQCRIYLQRWAGLGMDAPRHATPLHTVPPKRARFAAPAPRPAPTELIRRGAPVAPSCCDRQTPPYPTPPPLPPPLLPLEMKEKGANSTAATRQQPETPARICSGEPPSRFQSGGEPFLVRLEPHCKNAGPT